MLQDIEDVMRSCFHPRCHSQRWSGNLSGPGSFTSCQHRLCVPLRPVLYTV